MSAPTYLGAEQVMVDLWVANRLAAHAPFEAISPGLATRVFNMFAPADTPYPFIIFQVASPPRDVRGVGVVRVMVDTIYTVKAVAQVDSYAPLTGVAREIDAVMTAPVVSAVADGFVLASMREEQFSMVEVDGGKQYRHLGASYRIQAQAQQ